jgi:hypothetical protein
MQRLDSLMQFHYSQMHQQFNFPEAKLFEYMNKAQAHEIKIE